MRSWDRGGFVFLTTVVSISIEVWKESTNCHSSSHRTYPPLLQTSKVWTAGMWPPLQPHPDFKCEDPGVPHPSITGVSVRNSQDSSYIKSSATTQTWKTDECKSEQPENCSSWLVPFWLHCFKFILITHKRLLQSYQLTAYMHIDMDVYGFNSIQLFYTVNASSFIRAPV